MTVKEFLINESHTWVSRVSAHPDINRAVIHFRGELWEPSDLISV